MVQVDGQRRWSVFSSLLFLFHWVFWQVFCLRGSARGCPGWFKGQKPFSVSHPCCRRPFSTSQALVVGRWPPSTTTGSGDRNKYSQLAPVSHSWVVWPGLISCPGLWRRVYKQGSCVWKRRNRAGANQDGLLRAARTPHNESPACIAYLAVTSQ